MKILSEISPYGFFQPKPITEWDTIPEDIEIPEFDEILQWINNHRGVKHLEEKLKEQKSA